MIRPANKIQGYYRQFAGTRFARHVLRSNNDIFDDLFSSIEFISEVEKTGVQIFKDRGFRQNAKKHFKQFQSFVRQSKYFFEAARVLDTRSSPLIYYYAFLNLAKAYITLHDPDYVAGPVHHGISYTFGRGDLRRQKISTTRKDTGVFAKFFSLQTDTTLSNGDEFNIARLLGYCSDIAMELEMSEIEKRRFCYCKFAIVNMLDSANYTPLLAITNFSGLNKHARAMKPFHKYFEEVQLEKGHARELFQIFGEEIGGYNFFECSEPYNFSNTSDVDVPEIVENSYRAMAAFYEGNPYNNPFEFTLNYPYSIQRQHPMREVLSIYLIMFFLGSLVRYHPYYLESLLLRREAWVLESFIKSVPATFLRYMRNSIHGTNFIYEAR